MRRRAARAVVCIVAFAGSSVPRVAHAESDAEECAAAYSAAQVLRQHGSLLGARDAAHTCARATCPVVARKDCVAWAEQLALEIPTVVVVVRDEAGQDLHGVSATVDGAARPGIASGPPIELDPGDHALHFEREDSLPVDLKITVHQSERDRLIPVTMRATMSPSALQNAGTSTTANERPARRRDLLPVMIPAGIAILAFGTSAVLGLDGRSKLDHLRSSCAPNCSPTAVSQVRLELLFSDLTLGSGILATAVAGYFYLRPFDRQPPASGTNVAVAPTRGGAVAALQGVF